MARFVIRNYGPSRQIPYKGQQICMGRDQAIETDDEKMVVALGKADEIHVTDRGVEAAVPVIPEEPNGKKEREVTVDNAEAVHDENFPDEDDRQQPTQEDQQPAPDGDAEDEIPYANMTVKELQVLAKDREIKTSGLNKAELIQALEDYDAEPDESKDSEKD